jgi:Icc protein
MTFLPHNKPPLVIAQISDCHLFADKSAQHCGVNVYQNLLAVLKVLKENKDIDFIVFTGDLTQDHSEKSYQNFVEAVQRSQITVPIYFTKGNHDEAHLLNHFLSPSPFSSDKVIETPSWQIVILDSKSKTPAGKVSKKQLASLEQMINKEKNQLIFMHHHAIDVGYFIDKHGLKNSDVFWQTISNFRSIKAIACGHVHRALSLLPEHTKKSAALYTCPATSIQFDPSVDTVKALPQGPGYRLFNLNELSLTKEELLSTKAYFLSDKNFS